MGRDICSQLLQGIELPLFHRASLQVPKGTLTDCAGETRRVVRAALGTDRLQPGQTVAVAVGSREIKNQKHMVKAVVDLLREQGAKPFLIPAMGSHGGATAQGQREVLQSYGITESFVGAPIRSSMDTVLLGKTPDGVSVYLDAHAAGADWIVPLNRIKPHTDFHGKHESGLAKMLAIGLGKQKGASFCHEQGFERMSANVEAIANVVLAKAPILLAVGILEDCFHNTWRLAAMPPERLLEEDARLLLEAKSLIPRLPFHKADVLVLEEIGKDISGAGMDPNITGRSSIQGRDKPNFDRIVVLGLTEASHGNGVGIGVADVTTRRFADRFDPNMAYPNAITSRDTNSVRMPPVMASDQLAVQMAIQTLSGEAARERRVVWMRNTLTPDRLYLSESLCREATQIEALHIDESPCCPVFDAAGQFTGFMSCT